MILNSINYVWHVVSPMNREALSPVRPRSSALLEFANEKGKDRSDEGNQSEQPEAIKERQNAGLLLHQGMNLSHGARGCVGCGITVIDEAICNALYILGKRSIEIRNVRD